MVPSLASDLSCTFTLPGLSASWDSFALWKINSQEGQSQGKDESLGLVMRTQKF